MKFHAALFDLDGVIVNSEPFHEEAFGTVLSKHGYTLTHDDYLHYFAGKTDEAGFESMMQNVTSMPSLQQLMNEKAAAFIRQATAGMEAYPNVPKIIRELHDQDVKLALVTGSLRHEAELALKLTGILDLFAVIVSAEDIANSKPNPEGYLMASHALTVPAAECVVIEDSPIGVKAAKSAGMFCIAVTTTHSPEELSDASEIVDTLSISQF